MGGLMWQDLFLEFVHDAIQIQFMNWKNQQQNNLHDILWRLNNQN